MFLSSLFGCSKLKSIMYLLIGYALLSKPLVLLYRSLHVAFKKKKIEAFMRCNLKFLEAYTCIHSYPPLYSNHYSVANLILGLPPSSARSSPLPLCWIFLTELGGAIRPKRSLGCPRLQILLSVAHRILCFGNTWIRTLRVNAWAVMDWLKTLSIVNKSYNNRTKSNFKSSVSNLLQSTCENLSLLLLVLTLPCWFFIQ